MSVSELHRLAKEQLQTELNSYIKVKTIEKRKETNDTILYYVSGIVLCNFCPVQLYSYNIALNEWI